MTVGRKRTEQLVVMLSKSENAALAKMSSALGLDLVDLLLLSVAHSYRSLGSGDVLPCELRIRGDELWNEISSNVDAIAKREFSVIARRALNLGRPNK